MGKTLVCRPSKADIDIKKDAAEFAVSNAKRPKSPNRWALALSQAIIATGKSDQELSRRTLGETSVAQVRALRAGTCTPLPVWTKINQLLIQCKIDPAKIGQRIELAQPASAAAPR